MSGPLHSFHIFNFDILRGLGYGWNTILIYIARILEVQIKDERANETEITHFISYLIY